MNCTDVVANVILIYLSLPLCLPSCHCHFSGALKAIASGDPAKSLRDMMGIGVPGQSSALAPERVEEAFDPGVGSATTLREC